MPVLKDDLVVEKMYVERIINKLVPALKDYVLKGLPLVVKNAKIRTT